MADIIFFLNTSVVFINGYTTVPSNQLNANGSRIITIKKCTREIFNPQFFTYSVMLEYSLPI